MCPSCYEKQLRIDALQEEVIYLKAKLHYEERKTKKEKGQTFRCQKIDKIKIKVKIN